MFGELGQEPQVTYEIVSNSGFKIRVEVSPYIDNTGTYPLFGDKDMTNLLVMLQAAGQMPSEVNVLDPVGFPALKRLGGSAVTLPTAL